MSTVKPLRESPSAVRVTSDSFPSERLSGLTLPLDSGAVLREVTIAYKTYGTLNAAKSNAILVCHALTGDQYCTGKQPLSGRDGWWHLAIGAGKAIDTDKYFVICSNVLGSCIGTTGPRDTNPATGKAYGLDFPTITIRDMVRLQAQLIDHLGIEQLFAVIGPSMGGMQVLQWAASYPERVFSVICIGASYRHSAQNIAFHEVGRQAVMADPDWHQGRYYDYDVIPKRGLAVARMTAHITYMSEAALQRKFGRNLQDRTQLSYGFEADFQVESYLRHQGITFVDRFDANAYLYITRAVDYFDLTAETDGHLASVFSPKPRYLIMSLSSDWLFPTTESKAIVKALNAVAANVSFMEIQTDRGHDGFLHNEPVLHQALSQYLQGCARVRGVI